MAGVRETMVSDLQQPFVVFGSSRTSGLSMAVTVDSSFRSSRRFWAIITFAMLLRVAVFVFAALHPIANESGQPISPFHVHGIDYQFYQDTRTFYFNESLARGWERFNRAYGEFVRNFPDQRTELLLAPPLLPALYEIFGYGPDHTFPLAVAYLVLGCGLAAAWLWWLASRGVSSFWMLVFAALPNPLWYMLNPSTDLLFAAFTGGFIMLYWHREQSAAVIVGWVLCLLGLLFCRPNGIVLIGFVSIDLVLSSGRWRMRRLVGPAIVSCFGLAAAIYYLPYFIMVQYSSTTTNISYFGLYQADYFSGLFPALPEILNGVLSWLSLMGAKLLYFVGLRPSYSDLPLPLLVVRAAPGLVLLPGLIYGICCAGWQMRFFLFLFLLPMLLSVSQERYNLAIQPLLFYLGSLVIDRIAGWGRCRLVCRQSD